MDWGEIGTEVVLGIIGVVLTALGSILTYVINKYVSNDKLKTILNSLNTTVQNGVLEVYQTYVEELKDKNMFTEEAQKEALSTCLEKIKSNLTSDVYDWLNENYDDIDAYLTSLIESTIGQLKNSSSSTEVVIASDSSTSTTEETTSEEVVEETSEETSSEETTTETTEE